MKTGFAVGRFEPGAPVGEEGRIFRLFPTARLVIFAAAGAVVATALALADVARTGTHPAEIVTPGRDGPSAQVLLTDFPEAPLPPGIGHDGQQYYAIARDLPNIEALRSELDRPRYRMQRIAYPALAWMLHPTGGGEGLIVAMVIVSFLSLVGCGLAGGAVSHSLGGSVWPAFALPLLPGAYLSMRMSTAGSLALATGFGAIALSLHRRHRLALLSGIMAVLARESTWLLLLGFALWKRDRRALLLVTIPALVAGLWWAIVGSLMRDTGERVREFTLPLAGIHDSIDYWLSGGGGVARIVVPVAVLLGIWALLRGGLRHPLGPAIALQITLLSFLSSTVLGLDANGCRVTLPLMALAVVSLSSTLHPTAGLSASHRSANGSASAHSLLAALRRPSARSRARGLDQPKSDRFVV